MDEAPAMRRRQGLSVGGARCVWWLGSCGASTSGATQTGEASPQSTSDLGHVAARPRKRGASPPYGASPPSRPPSARHTPAGGHEPGSGVPRIASAYAGEVEWCEAAPHCRSAVRTPHHPWALAASSRHAPTLLPASRSRDCSRPLAPEGKRRPTRYRYHNRHEFSASCVRAPCHHLLPRNERGLE